MQEYSKQNAVKDHAQKWFHFPDAPCVCLITVTPFLLLIRPILAKEADYETRSDSSPAPLGVSFPVPRFWPWLELLALLNYESKPNQPVRR